MTVTFRRSTIKCATKGCWGYARSTYACGCPTHYHCAACAGRRSCYWCIQRMAPSVGLSVYAHNHFHLHASPRTLAAILWLAEHEFQPVDADNSNWLWCLTVGSDTCTKETYGEAS